MEKKTHCQICARAIKTVVNRNGVALIAHHGYQRPGYGYQTPSCHGARRRPYEVACDAIPGAIEAVKAYRAGQLAAMKKLLENPPEKLIHYLYGPGTTPREYLRPEGFDGKEALQGEYYIPHTYKMRFRSVHAEYVRNAKMALHEQHMLEKRYADWHVAHPRAKGDVL